jgi:type II secretory pathway predicted ATPase ExeA
MAQAQQLLEAEEAERHRRVVIVVDEAHLLTQQQLEELRLLTNSDMDSRSPFAGILLGQPTPRPPAPPRDLRRLCRARSYVARPLAVEFQAGVVGLFEET